MEKFPSACGVIVLPVWPRLVFCFFRGPRKGAGHKTNLLRQSTGQLQKLAAKRQLVSARPRLWNAVECSLDCMGTLRVACSARVCPQSRNNCSITLNKAERVGLPEGKPINSL